MEILEIAIIGTLASLFMQIVKKQYGPTSLTSKIIIVVVSIILGAGYVFLKGTPMFQTVLGILASASTFYAFFLKK